MRIAGAAYGDRDRQEIEEIANVAGYISTLREVIWAHVGDERRGANGRRASEPGQRNPPLAPRPRTTEEPSPPSPPSSPFHF